MNDKAKNRKVTLNQMIVGAAVVGIAGGLLLNTLGPNSPAYSPTLYLCDIIGKSIFLNLLKMTIIPLIFTSIAVGIANLRAHSQLGRVWKITLIYFFSSTSLAILLGLFVVNVFKPGAGVSINMFAQSMDTFNAGSLTIPEFFKSFIGGLFVNPIKAMAGGEILPTITFALFLGIALIVAGDKAKNVTIFLNEFFELMMVIINWVMYLLPIGLMALLIELFATQDTELFAALGKFMLIVIGATLFHGFVVLPLILKFFGRFSLRTFYSGIRECLITAFTTSSSSATMPVTLRCVVDNLKVNKDVAGFVVPLGATVNMDGTALYEAVAAVFVANLVGIELHFVQQLVVFFTAMVASIGAPGIPSAGMVTMIMVLQAVGLPAEAVAILIPIDRFLDTFRTMVNVEGDTIGSVIVDRYTKL